MQFEATLDQNATAEAGRMLRRRYEWSLSILRNLYGLLLPSVRIYAALVNLFSSDTGGDSGEIL
ncbi:MAG TPA: hypothetical protein VGM43_02520 [Bryobacteraceae bacterium]|jgi:hypothetical protein